MGAFNLLGNLFNRGLSSETNYLSLTLTSDKILASVWELDGKNLKFLGYCQKSFHNIDSLINETAVAIDGAAKNIKTDVSQAVFGLSYYWFEDGAVSKETLNILKNLSDELELKAQAFVPIESSISHFLKLENESAPPRALYVGSFKDFTEISCINEGKVEPKILKGSLDKENLLRLLKELKEDIKEKLPAQIIFFSTVENHHLAKELEKLEASEIFESTPKLRILTEEEVAKCVAYSQAADVLGTDPQIGIPAKEALPEAVQSEQPEHISPQPQASAPPVGFDFAEGQDILEVAPNIVEEPSKVEESLENVAPPKQLSNSDYAVDVEGKHEQSSPQAYESPQERLMENEKRHKKGLLESMITLSWLGGLSKKLSKAGTKKLLIGTAVVSLILFGALYFLSQSITSVSLIIKANSQPFEDDFNLTASVDSALDSVRDTIPAQSLLSQEADSAQASTTGSKKIGNNAKGEVKVFNWTTSRTTFDKNTTIISKDGIKFSLDSSVEIASRSASTPGEATVTVTAQDFGTKGNVGGGTDFTFQKYDELLYSAKNDNAFTGGDEKQITTVSQSDLDNLEKTLTGTLSDRAKNSLKEKNQDQQLADEAIDIKIVKKQFDKKLDDEAGSIKLDMEVEATALVYDQNNLKDILSQKAQNQSGKLESKPENVDFVDLKLKRAKNNLKITGRYRANLTPKIDIEDAKNKIAGKSLKDARAIVKSVGDFTDIEAKFTPDFSLFNTIPKDKSKISIKVEANK